MDLIKKLKESDNEILKNEANDLAKWSKLKHSKSDLEFFLNFNIAQIDFFTKDGKESSIVGTSNTTLIKIYSLKKDKDKKKLKGLKSDGMRTNDSTSVQIWDLIENKPKTIFLKSWQIMSFISINEDNILLLDKLLNEFLKK